MSTIPISAASGPTHPTRRITNRCAPAVVGLLLLVACASGTAQGPASTPVASTSTSIATAASEPAPTTLEEPTTTAVPATTTAPTTTLTPEDRLESWPAAPAEPAPVDAIARLLPTAPIVSAGVPVRAEAPGGNPAQAVFTQVFADADRDILLTLQSQPGAIESTPSDMRQPIAIDGWDEAFGTDGGLRVVAADPSGFVRLTGTGIDIDQAASIIATMQRRAGGTPGWDLSAEFDGLVEINGAWNESLGQRFVTWFDGDRVVAQMLTSPDYASLIDEALSPAFELVDVNGADGWFNANDGRRSVVWSPDGTTIVVLAVADEGIDPLAVARSVAELSVVDYESATTTESPDLGDGCSGSLFC